MSIPIEISARHIHLTHEDMEKLFGKNYNLKIKKDVSQPGQFAAEETLTIENNNQKIEHVRIVGPERKESQVEISLTDAYHLEVNPPVRLSGEIEGTPGITLSGPVGKIQLKKGLIIAKRHLHISPLDAGKLKLKHKDIVSVRTKGERAVIFNEVVVRSRKGKDEMSFQLDTDEANAAGVKNGDLGEII